jgi:hypothetical protein
MRKGFKELSPGAVKAWPEIFYYGGMRRLTAVLWFVTAFLAGAGLFLVTRPKPVLHAIVRELQGGGLFERCRQAGACGKPVPAVPRPHPQQMPSDPDRA